jgi:hypothetical protein
MKHVRLAAIAAFLAIPAFSLFAREPRVDDFRTATPEELAMKSVAFAPGASAVILDWVQWHDDTNFRQSEYVRVKILSEEGKKYGDIEIPYIPLLTNLDKVEARTTKPDGTIVPFTGKIYEKLIVKTGGVRMISKTFSLPDVQPGCIIEYHYTLGSRDAFLRATRFTVQRELPVLREMLWLKPYKEQYTSFFTYRGLPAGKKPVMTGDHYELALQDIPAFEKERYAPPEGELKPAVNFFYSTASKIDADPFWKDVGKGLTDSTEEFISGDPSPIHTAAAEAVAGATTPEEKLRKLYAITRKIENLGYEEEKTEAEQRKVKENHSAQDVLRNGYGYSDEINRLFIALARSAGFDAHAVRIASRDDSFFAKNLPISGQLDSEVCVVKVDGKDLFFDPGTPWAPYGVLAWQKGHVPGLKLVRKQDAQWVDTPQLEANEALVTRKAVLHVDGDALKGKITITYKGQEALVRRLRNYTDDEAATKKSLEEAAKSHFADGATVTLTRVTGMKAADPEVVAEYDVELPNTGSFAGSRAMIPLSVFHASAKNPFAPAKRQYSVYYEYPSVEEEDVMLEMPAGYAVETVPNAGDINGGAIVYKTGYEKKDNAVHFTRRMLVDSMFFPIEQYNALRTIYSRIASADQEQVILRKAKASEASK